MAANKKKYTEPVDIQLYVPDIGDKITLEKDWTFTLYEESRNGEFIQDLKKQDLLDNNPAHERHQEFLTKYAGKLKTTPTIESFKCYGDGYTYNLPENLLDQTILVDIRNDLWYKDNYAYATIPAGCVIHIDRIYIRKGASGYSSITFRVEGMQNMPKKSYRFWVKLLDTRSIKGKYQVLIREG